MEVLTKVLDITIVLFLVGNLLEVGLRLQVAEALAALRNWRFVLLALLWCFALGPALAVLLTRIMPLSEPYALGLVLLGLAPCSPALPVMVRKAGGSIAYMSAFMLLAFTGTVVLLPLAVPWLATGLSADPWAIAKPLLLFIAVPGVVGALVRRARADLADRFADVVKRVTTLVTIILVVVLLRLYGRDLWSTVGSFAIAAQLLYYAVMAAASYLLGTGLPYEQKAPLVLGVATRNVGPALAPLLALPGVARGAITMCVMAIFLGAILSGYVTAAVLQRWCVPRIGPAVTAPFDPDVREAAR